MWQCASMIIGSSSNRQGLSGAGAELGTIDNVDLQLGRLLGGGKAAQVGEAPALFLGDAELVGEPALRPHLDIRDKRQFLAQSRLDAARDVVGRRQRAPGALENYLERAV